MKNVNNSKNEEIWKDVIGFEGVYAVSDKGRVMNIKTGRILAGAYDGHGYRRIDLKGKKYLIHRLVALAFLPNPDNLPEVNHKNERKDDNNVDNLEWCTKSYNVAYSSHSRSCKIKQIDKDGNLFRIWESIAQIEKELGYARPHIVEACKGRQQYSHGFRWEYLDSNSQRVMNRPIIAFKGGKHIGEFASVKEVSEALGLKYHSVYKCVKGRIASNHGYTFRYK